MYILLQVDPKFLRNLRFSKKHNLKTKDQLKRAEKRKAAREAKLAKRNEGAVTEAK